MTRLSFLKTAALAAVALFVPSGLKDTKTLTVRVGVMRPDKWNNDLDRVFEFKVEVPKDLKVRHDLVPENYVGVAICCYAAIPHSKVLVTTHYLDKEVGACYYRTEYAERREIIRLSMQRAIFEGAHRAWA